MAAYKTLKAIWTSNCKPIDIEIKAYSQLMSEDEISTRIDTSVKLMMEKVHQYYLT